MSGGLEIVNPLVSPFLERVTKEERIGRDHPRRPRDGKPARAREEPGAEEKEEPGATMSSTHIDLRI